MKALKIYMPLLCFLFGFTQGKAQHCLENLLAANKALDAGKLTTCLNLARGCATGNSDESGKSQAYRLMSITWLQMGNSDSARWAAEKMLNIQPTYKPSVLTDPAEFIALLKTIVVIPKFSLGLAFSAGTNTALPHIENGYVVADYNKTYTVQSGLQFGTFIGFTLSPNWLVELGLLASSKRYKIDYSFPNWEVEIKERLTYLDMPLTVKYQKNIYKGLSANALLGVFSGYLLYAQNDFKSTYLPDSKTFELNRLNSIARRNVWNYGPLGGLGLSYKTNQGCLNLQCNYFHSLKNINRTNTRWSYPEQIFTYYYVDDDIRISNISVNLGYTYYLNYKVYHKKGGKK